MRVLAADEARRTNKRQTAEGGDMTMIPWGAASMATQRVVTAGAGGGYAEQCTALGDGTLIRDNRHCTPAIASPTYAASTPCSD